MPGSTTVALNSIAFSLLIGSLTSANIIKTLQRIGIKEDGFWDSVGREASLRLIFNLKRTRETGDAVKEFVDSFVSRRNNIAHKGDAIEPVNDTDVLRVADFLDLFYGVLGELATNAL